MNGVEELSLEDLEKLINGDDEQTPPAAPTNDNTTSPATQPTDDDKSKSIENTKAFAKRLQEKTDKAVAEAQDKMAKELGYESYGDYQKKREQKLLQDKGLDPDEVSPIVEQIVKQRLDDDPRIKELETLKSKQMQEFAKAELESIKALTDGEISTMDKIPADVIELWRKTGSLKQAYLQLHGEELIVKAKKAQTTGLTSHMATPNGSAPQASTSTRPLTAKEKEMWKAFYPEITDEELNKKTVNN